MTRSRNRAGSARSKAGLHAYRARRDFAKTAEPSGIGRNNVTPSEHLRFVVQKHDATRLHYDLRLELGDVFKSWAVTRGPSLDPAEKRLAVEVEDHPLAYGDFEGTIPEGEYGGGTVLIWDRGFWAPDGEQPPAEALADGELKLVLAGEKLRGAFVLVRLKGRPGDKRSNWLLIKHRDKWATPGRDAIQAKDRSVASGRTMAAIAKGSGNGARPFMTTGASISAAAVWDANAQAKAHLRSLPRRSAAGAGREVAMSKLTHPDRVLWPADGGLTKRDLSDYLAKVAPWMIRHIEGRPCSFLRAPNGIDGERFFQRHPMAGQPESLTAVTVDNRHDPYVEIDDAGTLVAMAQFSVIEFHPWNAAPHAPLVPGRLVFDLDPAPDVAFAAVVEAAREMRDLLEALGLVAFCKTTGGKGLHVVTPLEPDPAVSWEQAKLFANTVAASLVDRDPSRYLATMSKQKRKGRIFIDSLRTARPATAVAPLSPRARPGATVSMPLGWAQVRRDLDPARFTIRTAPALLARSSAWEDYDAGARPLRPAIEALTSAAR